MNILNKFAALCSLMCICASCSLNNDTPDTSSEWKNLNDTWILDKSVETDVDGSPLYEKITAPWDPNAYVLMRWHNDRSETQTALSPISTSTVDVRYEVRTIDSVMVDNSYARITPAAGVYRSVLNKNISGWVLGISQMHVGDTCTILIPYNQAYGSMQYQSLKPYSDLIFNVRLKDIPAFEKPI